MIVSLLFNQQSIVCFYRQTALHVASQAGNASVISALIQNGVDFDALDVNNDNALHVAVREGHLNVVRFKDLLLFCNCFEKIFRLGHC